MVGTSRVIGIHTRTRGGQLDQCHVVIGDIATKRTTTLTNLGVYNAVIGFANGCFAAENYQRMVIDVYNPEQQLVTTIQTVQTANMQKISPNRFALTRADDAAACHSHMYECAADGTLTHLSMLTTHNNTTNYTYAIAEYRDCSYAVATNGRITLYNKESGQPTRYADIPGEPLTIMQISTGDVYDIAVLTSDSRVYLASSPESHVELPEGTWRAIDWDGNQLIAFTQWNRIAIVPVSPLTECA